MSLNIFEIKDMEPARIRLQTDSKAPVKTVPDPDPIMDKEEGEMFQRLCRYLMVQKKLFEDDLYVLVGTTIIQLALQRWSPWCESLPQYVNKSTTKVLKNIRKDIGATWMEWGLIRDDFDKMGLVWPDDIKF